MLNTLPVPATQVAGLGNSATSLANLAEIIGTEHDAVVSALSGAVQHALAAGQALLAAKEQTKHGEWGKFLKRCKGLGERQAERYMHLARLVQTNPTCKSDLDLTGLTIEIAIQKLSPSKTSGKTCKRHSSPTPATHEKLSPRAWADASPAERTHFIWCIGWQSLKEAMPREWLVQVRFPKEVAVTIDQNGNVPTREEADRASGGLPEDGSIPPFLDRIQGRSKEEIDAESERLTAESKARSYRREVVP
jgi:hypothetical protein